MASVDSIIEAVLGDKQLLEYIDSLVFKRLSPATARLDRVW